VNHGSAGGLYTSIIDADPPGGGIFNRPRFGGGSHIVYSSSAGDCGPGLDGCVFSPFNEWSGLAVDDAGFGCGASVTSVDPWSGPDGAEFGCGASTTFVDPWSGPDEAEFGDEGSADGTFGFSVAFKYSSQIKSNSLVRFPHTVIASSGMCTTSTDA